MKIEFDQETDAMYIQLRDSKVKKSKEASPGIIIDYDKDKKMPAKEISTIDLKFPILKVTHR